MKIWYGYGSEHSANLVMIGHFQDAGDAAKAKQVIDQLVERVNAEVDAKLITVGDPPTRYTDRILTFLREVKEYHIGLSELEQFAYDVKVELNADQIVVTTDEVDVSGFLKVLLDNGARIEVYSAHNYAGTGHGRRTKTS